jgi:hypothetical protein
MRGIDYPRLQDWKNLGLEEPGTGEYGTVSGPPGIPEKPGDLQR